MQQYLLFEGKSSCYFTPPRLSCFDCSMLELPQTSTNSIRANIIKLPAENSTDNFMPKHYGEAQTIPKNFNASVIAASFSGGHFGCLEFSNFGLL